MTEESPCPRRNYPTGCDAQCPSCQLDLRVPAREADLSKYDAAVLNVIADAINGVRWTPLSVRYQQATAVLVALRGTP